MLDNLSKKNMIMFEKTVRNATTKIVLDILQALHENNDTLYKNTTPLLEFCSKNTRCVNWLKQREGKNIFHFFAYGIKNDLLKNILKNSKNDISLYHALKQSMKISRYGAQTYETPLHIAKEQSYLNPVCVKTKKLLIKADYQKFKKIYNNNPYHDIVLKNYQQHLDIFSNKHTSLEY